MKENGSPISQHSSGDLTRAAFLISGYIRKTLTQAEHDELDEWVAASDDNMKLFEELTDESNMEQNLAWLNQFNKEQALEKVRQKIEFNKPGKPVIKWRIWVAAASVLLIAALFFILKNNHGTKTEPAEIAEDVQPGGNKAIVTLSDGSVIDLSSAKAGFLKNDNGAFLTKTSEGRISYTIPLPSDSSSLRSDDSRLTYNTLTTPKTGQYMITLGDGTKVWLNAESSLKYPLGFPGKERKVQLTGEGYFEVAKDASRPFKVMLSDSTEVQVLGTHFNVMSYPDEASKEITLLEGSVKITQHLTHNSKFITPGQQAQLTNNSITINPSADVEEVIAWKNGQFVFHNEEISFIMRQVQRWYGVQVSYKINSSDHFNATISRNEPISKLLHYLEATNKIHFKIQNNIIYVLP